VVTLGFQFSHSEQRKKSLMKHMLLALALLTTTAAAQAPAATANDGAGRPPAAPVPLVGLNEKEGVSVDRFLGDPSGQPVHLSHGTLLTHSILTAGNPNVSGPAGAVLEYRKELATAELQAFAKTPLAAMPDEYFFYVKSGKGTLDDGKQMWDLHEGIAVLAPPTVPYRLTSTSDKPLEMIMLQWTAGPTPSPSLIVRDTHLLPWCEENAHWNNTSHCIFSATDGLLQGERIYTVMLQPWAVSQPHSHTPGTEEIWVKISPGIIPILLGSDLREMPENSAYLVPPTGKTDHSNINTSKTNTEWWVYIARGPANAQRPQGPRPNAGARPTNPNLSRDTQDATIAGRPLIK
jgi:hypothetical protein